MPDFLHVCVGTWVAAGLLWATGATADEAVPWKADAKGYQKTVAPFLKSHCAKCHGADAQAGEFRTDVQLPNDFFDRTAMSKWTEVVNVLNSHEMPPESEPQPAADDVAAVVEWITDQMVRAELTLRDGAIVLRRLNRDEYRNTMRDLLLLDVDVSGFPQDPPAGGFDNIGKSLTMSPLHTEIYLDAARKLLDRALVEGEKPPEIKWRFEVDSGDSDANRIRYDDQNPIVNGGNNRVEGGFKVVHHKSWDKGLNVRDFRVNHAGDYVVRIRAGGKVPTRAQVVASAEKILKSRWADQEKENPQGSRWHKEQYDRDLEHFKNDRMYDYGPPRIKLVQDVAGQPRTIAEFDVDAPHDQPKEYEVRTRLSTENAGLTIEYAYDIPRVLENFWLQGGEAFARPELWVDWMELEGPVHTSWPPASHVAVLPYSPKAKTDAKGYARDVLQKFMRKAWRRPATKPEVDEKYEMFLEAISEGYTGTEALKLPLASVLISPNFLFLTEPSSGANGRVLTDHELAARLSYFLWSSMPDDELSRLADAGKLKEKKTLAKQIDRMIAHPRSAELIDNFAGQWLQLREVGANPPAEDLYPQYDRHLELSIVEESKRFFEEILRNDLSVLNFVKSDFVVVNERLARYYGIPDVRGDHFRRVAVPPGVHRGGIVTQASILTVTSNGTRTSPVKRGTWVMKNVLGMDPGLPVANAGDIAPKVPGIDKATVRKRLEIHRELPQCARCHNKIDPLGFALENYNAAGEWRDQEGFGYKGRIERDDPKIDARSQLLDGTKIDGVDDLRDALLKQQDLFLNCLANKLTTYALGRELGLADQKLIKLAVAEMKTGKRTLRSLIHQIVNSDAFGRK